MREVFMSLINSQPDRLEVEFKVVSTCPNRYDVPIFEAHNSVDDIKKAFENIKKPKTVERAAFKATYSGGRTACGTIYHDGSIEFVLTTKCEREETRQFFPRCKYEQGVMAAIDSLDKPIFFKEWLSDFMRLVRDGGFTGGVAIRGAICDAPNCGIEISRDDHDGMTAYLTRKCKSNSNFTDILKAKADPLTRKVRIEYICRQLIPERPPLGRAVGRIAEFEMDKLTSTLFPGGFTNYSAKRLSNIPSLTHY